MVEKNKLASIEFITSANMDGMCGPEGCSIADHQKMMEEQQKQDEEKHDSKK